MILLPTAISGWRATRLSSSSRPNLLKNHSYEIFINLKDYFVQPADSPFVTSNVVFRPFLWVLKAEICLPCLITSYRATRRLWPRWVSPSPSWRIATRLAIPDYSQAGLWCIFHRVARQRFIVRTSLFAGHSLARSLTWSLYHRSSRNVAVKVKKA